MINNNTAFFARRSKTACYCNNQTEDTELFAQICDAIKNGYENFMFCPEDEQGIIFANQLLLRRKLQKGNKPDKIILVAVISHENNASDKSEEFREKYFDILAEADILLDLRTDEDHACEKFMISKSSLIICATTE